MIRTMRRTTTTCSAAQYSLGAVQVIAIEIQQQLLQAGSPTTAASIEALAASEVLGWRTQL